MKAAFGITVTEDSPSTHQACRIRLHEFRKSLGHKLCHSLKVICSKQYCRSCFADLAKSCAGMLNNDRIVDLERRIHCRPEETQHRQPVHQQSVPRLYVGALLLAQNHMGSSMALLACRLQVCTCTGPSMTSLAVQLPGQHSSILQISVHTAVPSAVPVSVGLLTDLTNSAWLATCVMPVVVLPDLPKAVGTLVRLGQGCIALSHQSCAEQCSSEALQVGS